MEKQLEVMQLERKYFDMKLNVELFEYSNSITRAVFYLTENLNHYWMFFHYLRFVPVFVSKVFKQVLV